LYQKDNSCDLQTLAMDWQSKLTKKQDI